MKRSALIKQRLVAIFFCGLLLLYSPIISIFDKAELWFGIPILYLYLFAIWAILIALMAWLTEKQDK